MADVLTAPAFRLRYRLRRWLMKRRMAQAPDPILVYTIGKTGSTSVVKTIDGAGRPAWQMHGLQASAIDERETEVETQRPRHMPRHLWVSQHFRHRLPTPERPWDVITLTRDPLAHSVSSFFQSAVRRRYTEFDATEMLAKYLAEHDVYRALNWFDDELMRFLGIDVYEHPFTPGQPLLIQMPTVRLLLLRREDLDTVGPKALSEFAGVKIDQMAHANVGDQKLYADAYQRFRANALLPRDLVEKMYGSRYARHFYSEEEIARFKMAWRTAARSS